MTETPTSLSPEARIQAFAEEVIAGTPLYVVEVRVRGRKGSQVVEIYIDGDEGVTVDQLAQVSREVGFLLEVEDAIKGKYNLNVSSPGVDRPLVLPRQYKKNLGRDLKVVVRSDDASQTYQGTLVEADEDAIVLQDKKRTQRIALADISSAHVQLPW